MTDLTKTYQNSGNRGLSTIESLEIQMSLGGGHYDSIKPSWCEPMRYQITVRPTTAQLMVLIRDMPDMFDSVDPVSE